MSDEIKEKVKVEEAKVYTELSKEKIDSIWKRREFTWKTNFVLWAGLVAVSAVLYKEAGDLPPNTFYWTMVPFIVIFIAHAWHWIGAYVSDEMGFSWAHYHQEQAEICLRPELSKTIKPHRPSKQEGWYYHLIGKYETIEGAMKKLHATIPHILVTAALMAVVLFLLHDKVTKKTISNASLNPKPGQTPITQPVDVNEPNSIRKLHN